MIMPTPSVRKASSRPALVFADTETDGLRLPFLPGGRRIWDIALCRRNPDGSVEWTEAFVRLADLPFDPHDPHLDRTGLDIGHFYERHPEVTLRPSRAAVLSEQALANRIMNAFRPTFDDDNREIKPVLIGAVPSFDDLSIGDLLRRQGEIDSETPWHYHLYDAETAAAARVGWHPHYDSKKLTRRLGVNPARFAAHTARGDVEWAMALYDMAYAPLPVLWAARAALWLRTPRRSRKAPPRPAQAREAA